MGLEYFEERTGVVEGVCLGDVNVRLKWPALFSSLTFPKMPHRGALVVVGVVPPKTDASCSL